jgi:hypothetical protein
MKSHNGFWTAFLLLAVLGIASCSLELAQEEQPAAEQTSEKPQEQQTGA